ncbi:epoxide hydrolase [Pacificimonas flava]|uniref:Epoxide hydrolase n=2 Tax=Pacificimonas TaxID=1960290 RepID=A0A219B8D0_9SPHN|nr:epoxide hydrolase [Pacificimonas flava]
MIPVGDIELETVVAGPPDSGKLAVLLHGFPELNVSWRHQIPMLAERGWRVWAPNMRGYGASSKPKGVDAYSIDILREDIGKLFDAARAEAPAGETLLMAHDWGGAVAWAYAIGKVRPLDRLAVCNMPHPATFGRALKLSSKQKRRSWYMGMFQIPRLPELMMTAGNARAVRRAFRGMAAHPENFPDELLDIYAEAAQRPGAMTAMINYYRAAARMAGRRESGAGILSEGGQVDIPTLLVWGTGDTALGLETLDGIDQFVPNLERKFLPGISHWVQQDAPEEVNRIVADWLDRAGV